MRIAPKLGIEFKCRGYRGGEKEKTEKASTGNRKAFYMSGGKLLKKIWVLVIVYVVLKDL